MEQEIKSLYELDEYARLFTGDLKKQPAHATIIGLSGELGAGKTAFTKALAKILGIDEDVSSPTFVIAKFYELKDRRWNRLVHIDAYRIEHPDELRSLRFSELINDSCNLIVIEWPELMKDAFPKDALVLQFKFITDTVRSITNPHE